MKKNTLQFFTAIALLAGISCFAQGTGATYEGELPVGYQNNYGTQDTRNNAVSDVLIAASPGDPSWIMDVEAKIEAIGEHDVETFLVSGGTPTLAELQGYDAVFVFTDSGAQDPVAFGNVLAQYIEGGGAVVDATFTPNVPITGGFTAYELYSASGQSNGTNLMLGTINDPSDPMLLDVNSIDGGTASFHNTGGTVANGAFVVAEWSDASPFLIRQENVGPMNVRRAFINLYPPSIDARDDFWDISSDMSQLMSNALEWTITGDVLSTDENDIVSNITLFPNPAQNEITISRKGDLQINSAQIIDIAGRVVNSFIVENLTTTVNISELKLGVYFLKVEGQSSSQSLKFIKD